MKRHFFVPSAINSEPCSLPSVSLACTAEIYSPAYRLLCMWGGGGEGGVLKYCRISSGAQGCMDSPFYGQKFFTATLNFVKRFHCIGSLGNQTVPDPQQTHPSKPHSTKLANNQMRSMEPVFDKKKFHRCTLFRHEERSAIFRPKTLFKFGEFRLAVKGYTGRARKRERANRNFFTTEQERKKRDYPGFLFSSSLRPLNTFPYTMERWAL